MSRQAVVHAQELSYHSAPKLSRALGFQGGSCILTTPSTADRPGTNARLHRFLRKVRSGEPFTLAAIGGSVSSGHGCGCYPLATCENNMHRRIFDHLDKLFPAQNGTSIGVDGRAEGKNTFINGAVPATGEWRNFGVLWRTLMRWQEATTFPSASRSIFPRTWILSSLSSVSRSIMPDRRLIAPAINDQNNFANVDNMELMIRGLMDLPSQPAIINAQ